MAYDEGEDGERPVMVAPPALDRFARRIAFVEGYDVEIREDCPPWKLYVLSRAEFEKWATP